MKTFIQLLTIMLVLNIFMYIAVNFCISFDGASLNKDYNFHFKGDLIDSFLSGNNNLDKLTQDTKDNWTSYGVGINANFSMLPDQQSGVSTGAGGINFLDSLKIIWGIIPTLANFIISPLTLFFNFRMPFFIGIMIGIPYFFIMVLCLYAFIRGAGD